MSMYMAWRSEELYHGVSFSLHLDDMVGVGDFVLTGELIWFIRIVEFSVWEFRRPCIF